MSQGQSHPYHLVDPSPWPALGALGVFTLAVGGVLFMHMDTAIGLYIGLGLVLITMFGWWRDVVKEAEKTDAHTSPVQYGLKMGMVLFIASEVMFFVAFFWAFFYHGFYFNQQTEEWPPADIEILDPWGIPFINTLILLTSGGTLMWASKKLKQNNRHHMALGILLSIILGVIFLALQVIEYGVATFGFEDGIFPSTFYMATGFHGFHVFVGVCFLTVCYFRTRAGHFTPDRHIGFMTAEWYWHFVDVVWLFLFVWVYVWPDM